MTDGGRGQIAILYPGDYADRAQATPENNRFADLFQAFAAAGIDSEPAVYRDDFCAEVRGQLMQVDAVLVWVNPIQDGCNRAILDAMLREVADAGIFVSAHPDVILKLGTKEVLYRTRDIGWGCDTHLYASMEQMIQELPARLANGKARVVKQHRGNGGLGVWKVQLPVNNFTSAEHGMVAPRAETIVRVRHARRGCSEKEITLSEFFARCDEYFFDNGRMIDQEYQEAPPGRHDSLLPRERSGGRLRPSGDQCVVSRARRRAADAGTRTWAPVIPSAHQTGIPAA
jgi:hypothetical protein